MKFLFQNRRFFLGLIVAITLVFGFFLPNVLPVNFSFESFFPKDKELEFYKDYRETFKAGDNGIFAAFESGEKGIFDHAFLTEVDSLLTQVSELDHVDSIVSPTNLPFVQRTPLGVARKKMLDLNSQESIDKTRKRLEEDPFLGSIFISKDGKSIGAVILMDAAIANLPSRNVLCQKIGKTLAGFSHRAILSGTPYVRSQLVDKIRSELFMFLLGSTILILSFLVFIYRSIWGVVIPILAVIGAVVWNLGFMGMLGYQIDIVNNLLPPIMFVVAMADIIHMITKYTQELGSGKSKDEAMKATLSKIGNAILLTSITTAIGFGSLATSAMVPMRSFGLFAAAGVMFAYLIAIVLIPNALYRINPEKLLKKKGIAEFRIWDVFLEMVIRTYQKHPRSIFGSFVLILILSGIGIATISLDAYLIDDLREGDSVRNDLTFFEDNFNGIRPFEMAIVPAEGKKITDLEILKDIEKIEGFLNEKGFFGPFLSPVSFFKNANRVSRYNVNRHYKLPRTEDKVEELLGLAIASGSSSLIRGVMTEDLQMGRVSAQMTDIGTDRFALLKNDVQTFIQSDCQGENFSFRLTGNAYFYTLNVKHLQRSLFIGLGLAFLVIGLLMGGIFKSFKMVLIALIPNIIPLLIIGGMLGFTGIGLKASTSVVFVISFGIAVDVTIHFLSRLRLELKSTGNLDLAIRNTIMGTGKALILTSAIIISGFILFLFSNLGGTFAIGLFVTTALVVSLVANLLLMPVIVKWAYKDSKDLILEPEPTS